MQLLQKFSTYVEELLTYRPNFRRLKFFFQFHSESSYNFLTWQVFKSAFWNSEVMIQRCKAIKKVMDLACSPSLQAFLSPSFSQDQSTQADLKRYLLLFVIF